MRPSFPRLVRLVPRATVTHSVNPSQPRPKIFDELPKDLRKTPPLIEVLQKRKEAAGADYPPNIRIEPVVSKKTFEGVQGAVVGSLREILKER